jgi:hypothetical protein
MYFTLGRWSCILDWYGCYNMSCIVSCISLETTRTRCAIPSNLNPSQPSHNPKSSDTGIQLKISVVVASTYDIHTNKWDYTMQYTESWDMSKSIETFGSMNCKAVNELHKHACDLACENTRVHIHTLRACLETWFLGKTNGNFYEPVEAT